MPIAATNAFVSASTLLELKILGIDLTVDSERLILRGVRDVLPEPTHAEGRAVQLLAMEIDCGPFEREVRLPAVSGY